MPRFLAFRLLLLAVLLFGAFAACSSELETPGEVVGEDVASPAAREWWDALSDEEQNAMLSRMQRMRKLQQAPRDELSERAAFMGDEMRRVMASLSEEERQALHQLPKHERNREIRKRVHSLLSEHNQRFQKKGSSRRHNRTLEERMRHSRMRVHQARQKDVLAKLNEAAELGFIEPDAVSALASGPVEDAVVVLGHVQKEMTLKAAREQGFWEKHEVTQAQQAQVEALPPREFFRAFQMIRSGVSPQEACDRCSCDMEMRPGMGPGMRRDAGPNMKRRQQMMQQRGRQPGARRGEMGNREGSRRLR